MSFRFGPFTLDKLARQLVRGSIPIHLSPKALDLLTLLVQRRPEAVSKTEIHESLWKDTHVADINVAVLIAEIRTALGDDARHPQMIRTVHRFGYAFCGTAVEASGSGDRHDVLAPCWISRGPERYPLEAGENVVGRDPTAHIRIDAVGVSRRHAMIVVGPDGALLHDLDSKNGTYLDDRRVTAPMPLEDGAEIWFGPASARFHRSRPLGSTLTVNRGGRGQLPRGPG